MNNFLEYFVKGSYKWVKRFGKYRRLCRLSSFVKLYDFAKIDSSYEKRFISEIKYFYLVLCKKSTSDKSFWQNKTKNCVSKIKLCFLFSLLFEKKIWCVKNLIEIIWTVARVLLQSVRATHLFLFFVRKTHERFLPWAVCRMLMNIKNWC